jgi:hypothetical protein
MGTPAGYRVYSPEVLGVLDFVTQARRLGLTLKEICHIVALRGTKSGRCAHVRGLLEQSSPISTTSAGNCGPSSTPGTPRARGAESSASTSKEADCHG